MRVLLVRLSALGDVIHTWPLATELKAAAAVERLAWVVEEPLLPLVEGHPAVDEAIPVATRRWRRHPLAHRTRREAAALRARLATLAPDLCLDPQGVAKSALVTWWSRAPRRLGFARPWRREAAAGLAYTETVPLPEGLRHVVDRNLHLAAAAGLVPAATGATPDGGWLLGRLPPPPAGGPAGAAVLLPAAGGAHKLAPPGFWAEVARRLAAAGLPAVVAWGPGERGLAERVAAEGGATVAPPTDLLQLAALLAAAAVVVGGDTGPVHLAASLGTPTVALFLATDPARNAPRGDRVAVVSCVEPAAGPGASARARPVRRPDPGEVAAAAAALLPRRRGATMPPA